jgi:hypothetical protein
VPTRKREPKHRGGDLKGSGIFPQCCGLTCCGCVSSSRSEVRAHRNREKKKAVEEGFAELVDVSASTAKDTSFVFDDDDDWNILSS